MARTLNPWHPNALLARRWAKPIVFAVCLIPLFWLVWLVVTDDLGAEPVIEGVRQTGLWALRLLLVALAVTPLKVLTGITAAARFRRMIGLFAFFYVTVHILAYVGADQFFDWNAIWRDIVKRPYITVGMGAFVILTALAITSTNGMVRRLGGRRWKTLHKAVFLAGACACLHFIMLVKGWQRTPLIYAAIFLGLLAVRVLGTKAWQAFARSRADGPGGRGGTSGGRASTPLPADRG